MDGAWHLDKRVTVGNLATTLTVVAALLVWGSDVEKRIALNERGIDDADKRIELLAETQSAQYRDLVIRLDAIRQAQSDQYQSIRDLLDRKADK